MSEQTPVETNAAYERRAPGWVIRCLTCGLTEPLGKYAIRRGAAGRPRRLHWCPRCRWLRCCIIDKR